MARMDPFREAGVDFVTVMISRETVEAGDLAPALGSLSALVESRESARHFLGRVDLAIGGYDDDPRELFEVPEVRAYLTALDAQFSYWFPFLCLETETLKLQADRCARVARRFGTTRGRRFCYPVCKLRPKA